MTTLDELNAEVKKLNSIAPGDIEIPAATVGDLLDGKVTLEDVVAAEALKVWQDRPGDCTYIFEQGFSPPMRPQCMYTPEHRYHRGNGVYGHTYRNVGPILTTFDVTNGESWSSVVVTVPR